jgi:hypothetical protein
VIRRRSGWEGPDALEKAAAISKQIGDEEMSDEVRWIRSYVVQEEDGQLGTLCVYQAVSPEALPDTVIIRPDPEPAATG